MPYFFPKTEEFHVKPLLFLVFLSFRPSTVYRNFDYNFVVKIAYISPTDEHSFRQFITERPALNLSVLADEIGVHRANLLKIISGLRKIPKAKHGRCYQVAQKHRYFS